jgi:hypothetical protein
MHRALKDFCALQFRILNIEYLSMIVEIFSRGYQAVTSWEATETICSYAMPVCTRAGSSLGACNRDFFGAADVLFSFPFHIAIFPSNAIGILSGYND